MSYNNYYQLPNNQQYPPNPNPNPSQSYPSNPNQQYPPNPNQQYPPNPSQSYPPNPNQQYPPNPNQQYPPNPNPNQSHPSQPQYPQPPYDPSQQYANYPQQQSQYDLPPPPLHSNDPASKMTRPPASIDGGYASPTSNNQQYSANQYPDMSTYPSYNNTNMNSRPSQPLQPSYMVPPNTTVQPNTYPSHTKRQSFPDLPPVPNSNNISNIPPPISSHYAAPQPIDQYNQYPQGQFNQPQQGQFNQPQQGQFNQPQQGQFNQPQQFQQYGNNIAAPSLNIKPYAIPDYVNPCPAAYLQPTMSIFPATSLIRNKAAIPVGVIVQPLAPSDELPVVNFGELGVIRCSECRGYINPYCVFPIQDRGQRWRCNLCHFLNDVPNQYVSPLDAEGNRMDASQRIELSQGAYEIIAPAEYAKRQPPPPSYIFVIDVSKTAIATKSLFYVASSIREYLNSLPGNERTMIGFITIDSRIHFHNLRSTLKKPHMLVVSDLEDVFLPAPDDLFVNLNDSRHLVEMFLDSLYNMHQYSQDIECALGPALESAISLLSPASGKIIAFLSSLPSMGIGALKNRENPKLIGTDKENELLKPSVSFYKDLSAKCVSNHICFDAFFLTTRNRYLDVSTISLLARYTGGQVYYINSYLETMDSASIDKLRRDLFRCFTVEQGLESVVRVRCSKGLAISAYHGNFTLKGTDLITLPIVDGDKSVAVEIRYEENATNVHTITHHIVQAALLYSTTFGERRIRVFTIIVPVTNIPMDLFQCANAGAISNLLNKCALDMIASQGFAKSREFLYNRLITMMNCYRNSNGGAVRLNLASISDYPDSLSAMPLQFLAMQKVPALKDGADNYPDERSAAINTLYAATINKMDLMLRPKLICLTDLLTDSNYGVIDPANNNIVNTPNELNLSSYELNPNGVFLLDNGEKFLIIIGSTANTTFTNNVFNLTNTEDIALNPYTASTDRTSYCAKVHNILDQLRLVSGLNQSVSIFMEGSYCRDHNLFNSCLLIDRTQFAPSYDEFIPQIARATAQ